MVEKQALTALFEKYILCDEGFGNIFDPAHPERNTPESFIQANAESFSEASLDAGIDNRINTIKNSNEEER